MWFSSTEFSEEYLNKDLYFYDEHLNPIHCISDLKRIDYTGGTGSVKIKNFDYSQNIWFHAIPQFSTSLAKYIILDNGQLLTAGESNYGYDGNWYIAKLSFADWEKQMNSGSWFLQQ